MVEGAVAFYLHLAGTMEDQFLILHRHYPYQMAETRSVCRSHLESIYNCLLDIFEEGIQKGLQDGSVNGDLRPTRRPWSSLPWWTVLSGCNTYRIYDAGTLYGSLMAPAAVCSRMPDRDRHGPDAMSSA